MSNGKPVSIEPDKLHELYRLLGGGRLNFIMDEEMITIVTDHEALDAKWGDRLVWAPKGWRVESAQKDVLVESTQ